MIKMNLSDEWYEESARLEKGVDISAGNISLEEATQLVIKHNGLLKDIEEASQKNRDLHKLQQLLTEKDFFTDESMRGGETR